MHLPSYRGIGSILRKIPLTYYFLLIFLGFLFWYTFALPRDFFNLSYSTVVEDRNGKLLGANISDDGQWRFPPMDTLPSNYIQCLLTFEDKRFFNHPGVDVLALGRAVRQDLKAGVIRSGGSTISMQVIRISRPPGARNIFRKLIEIILATRLELSYSKNEILGLYASNAPFGGNVRGIGAASWRYFGRNPDDLSWAESALLAVLPNSPALIHPARNRNLLLEKRNNLLDKLLAEGKLDSMTNRLAKAEPLPEKPQPIPMLTPHLVQQMRRLKPGRRILTTLDIELQKRSMDILRNFQRTFEGNGIHNAAVLICEQETGNVMVYIGNSVVSDGSEHAAQVDIVHSNRSYGSLLKPVLFASMLDEGTVLPSTLIPDIPTNIAGFVPKNFDRLYDGAVPARRALARSLNIPAVRLLQQYGYEKFNIRLRQLGIHSLSFSPDHYGLSVILGGAEANLWELAGMYSSMSRVLIHYGTYNGKYDAGDFHPLNLFSDSIYTPDETNFSKEPVIIHASSIWQTYQALVEVNRPDAESFWQSFSSKQPVAWKTGTSFGNRDAWAIGSTRKYIVAVWIGNADGEGRPLLTGVGCAAPVMFALMDLLPVAEWFDQPYDEMIKVPICRQSGYRPSQYCTDTDSIWINTAGLRSVPCPYHLRVFLNKGLKFRVNSSCCSDKDMISANWFVLPPAMEWYYKSHDPTYRILPPMKKGCNGDRLVPSMEIIYPHTGSKVFIPKELSGRKGRVIMEAVHRRAGATIYWHLDDQYVGETTGFHQMALEPSPGKHVITLVDQEGESLVSNFLVVGE